MIKTFCLFVIPFFWSLPCFSAIQKPERGDQFVWACGRDLVGDIDTTQALETINCLGYLDGILDGFQVIFRAKPDSMFICLPERGISIDQARKIVIKWLDDRPEELDKSIRITIAVALAEAFPCP